MTRIYDLAHQYVKDLVEIDPSTATALGLPGHEREMSDYSPDGYGRTAELNRRTLEALDKAEADGKRDTTAREMISERLRVQLDMYDAREHMRSIRIIGSPLQRCRSIFDDMPKTTEEEWSNIAARLALVPEALAGYRQTLDEGLAQEKTAARRQAGECARQCETWAGLVEGQRSYFEGLAETLDKAEVGSEALRTDVGRGVRLAKDAFAAMGAYLRQEYAPRAAEREGSGPERYGLLTRVFLGTEIDVKSTYEWGWEQLHEIESEMAATADRISPGASVEEATELLETDTSRAVAGVEAYREWLQVLHDDALTALHGTHFEIPEEIRRMEVMIPPAGSAAAAYYTGPSEDFARPGRTWWPTMGRDVFPKWGDVTTAYHEGVPGHHLQVGGARCLGEELSRYQRLLGFISGYGEGWALYAERLMGELGYLENPDYYMGLLSAQALRAVRVIIDIGMHHEMQIPAGEAFHPGEVWGHDLAVEFAIEKTRRPREFMSSEVVRYLGWAAQAISYKVGERFWLEAREAAKQRMGPEFDLKRFHSEALDLGPMGLGQLKRELGG
jgi:uncharacterized protein (DUF885 family)